MFQQLQEREEVSRVCLYVCRAHQLDDIFRFHAITEVREGELVRSVTQFLVRHNKIKVKQRSLCSVSTV
jgi:hypothetical protein